MTRFLHSSINKSNTENLLSVWVRERPVRFAIILFTIFFGQQVSAQQLDTWFTADRAINVNPIPVGSVHLFTPYAPADGTPVNIWYDFVDFTPQDGVPHPNPADYPSAPPVGFDYPFGTDGVDFLSPIGSRAGIPTLRRDIMNFNPAVEFDGSGNGEALHFRSNSRNEIAVFIVFQGAGAGNNAEEQRLLFGGDIDVHPNSLSNLSLGVSAGNRFSVGRTWDSDGGGYFQSGSIDLQQRPTIATFVRDIVEPLGSEQEQLETWVNGLPDINVTRNHPTSESELFVYNRLGKHFNSNDPNRNFTGYIAEVLLLDTPAEINLVDAIERTQSYLAIKYGITLNETGGLGSINGNTSFYYLAADGSIIWDWDINSPYNYDIAGIGKDRFDDIDNTPGPYNPTDSYFDIKYRYNLYQRISKSVNPEAIVTVSTNSNFATDNLDDTRTAIDTGPSSFSTRHNYLIWGNDRASILSTNAELPDGGATVTERISREWKVQMSRSSFADDPIQGVSVRVELSGSDIPLTDPCALHLMIDTDGDGDFTTGSITYIPATSIVGTDAFFDNVDFEDRDVFSIGYGDFEPPTASNPPTVTVCDTVPAPDPSIVTDEDDNCAVASVVHFADLSDLGTNPEIITRTYRITDTSGNFTDVQQTINVYTSPDAGTDAPIAICTGNGASTDLFAALGGADAGGTWNDDDASGADLSDPTDVDFSAIGPGIYDFTYTIPATGGCPADAATVTVTITDQPLAGTDAPIAICTGNGASTDLFAALGGADAGGTWNDDDASGADLSDPTDVDFSAIGPGIYDFTYTIPATGGCPADAATVTVTITDQPLAGTDAPIAICTGNGASTDLFAALGGADAGGTWNDDDASGADLSDPTDVDFSAIGPGIYDFTYTIPATGGCPADAATVTVTITDQPLAGTDAPLPYVPATGHRPTCSQHLGAQMREAHGTMTMPRAQTFPTLRTWTSQQSARGYTISHTPSRQPGDAPRTQRP
ncbi:hypothetical protein [Flagellimonas sp. C4]|uniref:hypothetical protein n=1 Tax=Flagellimonas alginolytica TaxID=3177515 RepID=UPI0035C8DD96